MEEGLSGGLRMGYNVKISAIQINRRSYIRVLYLELAGLAHE